MRWSRKVPGDPIRKFVRKVFLAQLMNRFLWIIGVCSRKGIETNRCGFVAYRVPTLRTEVNIVRLISVAHVHVKQTEQIGKLLGELFLAFHTQSRDVSHYQKSG